MKTYCDLSHFDSLSMPIGIVGSSAKKFEPNFIWPISFEPNVRTEDIFKKISFFFLLMNDITAIAIFAFKFTYALAAIYTEIMIIDELRKE